MPTTTRDRILDAAAQVMQDLGLARTTTKQIARAAGYSEATLYKHFAGKEELFLEVLQTRVTPLVGLLAELPGRAGRGTLRAHLEEVATGALAFYRQSMPMSASVFSSPELLAGHRDRVHGLGAGPHRATEMLADYLRAEQGLGRLDPEVDADSASALLLGACFHRAFLAAFAGTDATVREQEQMAADLVRTLGEGLQPEQ